MRSVKMITSKDHVLLFIIGDTDNSELTCINKTTDTRAFPAPFTAFGLEGVFKTFIKDENDNWEAQRTIAGPNILFRNSSIEAGTISVTNTVVVGILPKKREFLETWVSTLGEVEMNVAIETSRDSHVTISEGSTVREMDANTFIELDSTIDDEIVFE